MQKTEYLELPIYDTPDVDVFDLQDWNIANQNLDNAFKQIVSNGEQVELTNTEIIQARKGKATLKEKIDDIDSSLDAIKNYIYFSLVKGDNVGDRFDFIFKNYTNGIILINEDLTLEKTLIIPKGFSLLSLNKNTITTGEFDGIKFSECVDIISDILSINNTEITIQSTDGFGIGDIIKITPKINAQYSMISTICKIDGNKIYMTTPKFELPGGNFKITKITNNDSFIKGFKFNKTVKTNFKDVRLSGCCGVKVIDNEFTNCEGITLEGAINCTIKDNSFKSSGDSIFIYDCDGISIINNKLEYFEHGIRGAYISECTITDNELINGKNERYSVGIEISGVTLETFKCCYNIIKNNRVENVNKGVPGSANGGIHLNFNAHHNIIDGNIVLGNGIGIYLENYCANNTIINNISSYNTGYYGVGIELDWNCHNNKIISNTCEFNNGSVEACESCGIEVRCGKTDVEHMILNTTVSNNVCRNNGKHGMFLSGKNILCSNNICENNGINQEHGDDRSEILLIDSVNPKILCNTLDVGGNYGLLIKNSDNVTLNSNNVNSKGSDINGVFLEGVNNCFINNNSFELSSTQRRVNISSSKNVYVESNVINGNDNGYSQLEFNNVNGYLIKYNIITGNTKIVEWECSNKIE